MVGMITYTKSNEAQMIAMKADTTLMLTEAKEALNNANIHTPFIIHDNAKTNSAAIDMQRIQLIPFTSI